MKFRIATFVLFSLKLITFENNYFAFDDFSSLCRLARARARDFSMDRFIFYLDKKSWILNPKERGTMLEMLAQ